MQIDQARLLNERMGTLPDVYYYSVPCSYTKKSGDNYIPKKGMEPFFVMRSYQIGQYTGMTKGGTEIGQEWKQNDGRVSTISETAPFGAPSTKLDRNHLRPGIWNVYPVYPGDHMSLQGGLLHKKNIRPFYLDLLAMIRSAE
ncbi:MAG: hypothetical protein K6A40_11355 [Solobacterium sp.]|nr:hypothetical protein [Solobacterium sp.]